MINFLSSNFFPGIATIITGFVVIGIYFWQKKDAKVQAARVLLMEIRTAEERLEQIREKITTGATADIPSVLPTKSWKTYSHLFVRDFDQDELKLLSVFYDYCELIEEFGRRQNDFFWVSTEERARVTQQKLAQIIDDAFLNEQKEQYIITRRDYINGALDKCGYSYTPQKTLAAIQNYLSKIQMITTSTCGSKLKCLAKIKN